MPVTDFHSAEDNRFLGIYNPMLEPETKIQIWAACGFSIFLLVYIQNLNKTPSPPTFLRESTLHELAEINKYLGR